ncbi:iminoacetate synthase [Seminavis robusta]|uniref:Iminoacetate synthase n=1 Tax=Seminavis robusta TaxID=568900 RepID=A0A9N8ER77_9STRA|nr:iminoacetate synthase [Seminavis robusta]|eukprot:Sro1555_g282170.1 iminoacetate synthase (541) ;mRNA; f:20686-22308
MMLRASSRARVSPSLRLQAIRASSAFRLKGTPWSHELEPHPVASASEIVNPALIEEALEGTKSAAMDPGRVHEILENALDRALLRSPKGMHPIPSSDPQHEFVQGLTLEEAATLLNIKPETQPELMDALYKTALQIKERIYGNRIVLFAPLYLSNYCVNSCTYCAFRGKNKHIPRSVLTKAQLIEETEALQRMGHRRLLLLTGEHPKYSFDDFLGAIHTVASVRTEPCGSIRRINVEIPTLSVSDIRRLKETDHVGTYTVFQETYHPEAFKRFHPSGPKSDYEYRLQTMDRAQIAGVDDVGIGALFGLHDYRFECLGMLQHARHLDKTYQAGPHTISIPRIRPADQAPDALSPPHPVDDENFAKLVAVLRCAVPYTGMILSTRESPAMRARLLNLGISQMSAGSKTDVGSYHKGDVDHETELLSKAKSGQFSLLDKRPLDEVVKQLMLDGFVPSFCTACYRKGRTGAEFMAIAKKGNIHKFCHPNSLLTLQEYLEDYASSETRDLGEIVVEREATTIGGRTTAFDKKMKRIREGERDLYF